MEIVANRLYLETRERLGLVMPSPEAVKTYMRDLLSPVTSIRIFQDYDEQEKQLRDIAAQILEERGSLEIPKSCPESRPVSNQEPHYSDEEIARAIEKVELWLFEGRITCHGYAAAKPVAQQAAQNLIKLGDIMIPKNRVTEHLSRRSALVRKRLAARVLNSTAGRSVMAVLVNEKKQSPASAPTRRSRFSLFLR